MFQITPGFKVGTLSQDQFAFEAFNVIDTVIMGDYCIMGSETRA